MNRFKLFVLTLAFCFIAAPAAATLQDMQASVYKWEGGMGADGRPVLTQITSGITFQVLAINTTTAESLYYPQKLTSLTNPVSTTNFASTTVCNKRVAFRVDPTDATNDRYVDLIVTDTNGGYSIFVENFDQYQHTIVIDERPNVVHHGMIAWSAVSTTEKLSGVTFLPYTFIQDVRVEVVGTVASGYLDVGLKTYDSDGFRDNVLLTTAGFIQDTGVITSGASNDYTAVSTYGALLHTALTGDGNVTAGNYNTGGRSFIGHVVLTADSGVLAYTGTCTAAAGDGSGFIHYFFTRMR